MSHSDDSYENINLDNINPLQSMDGREYIIGRKLSNHTLLDLTNQMKSSKRFKEIDERFTPIKEDEDDSYDISNPAYIQPFVDDYDLTNSREMSSFPSSIWIDDFDKTNTKFDKAIDHLKDVLRSIDL